MAIAVSLLFLSLPFFYAMTSGLINFALFNDPDDNPKLAKPAATALALCSMIYMGLSLPAMAKAPRKYRAPPCIAAALLFLMISRHKDEATRVMDSDGNILYEGENENGPPSAMLPFWAAAAVAACVLSILALPNPSPAGAGDKPKKA